MKGYLNNIEISIVNSALGIGKTKFFSLTLKSNWLEWALLFNPSSFILSCAYIHGQFFAQINKGVFPG